MGKKIEPNKIELAYLLYLSGVNQTDICERIQISMPTLKGYIKEEGWDKKRAAKNITRQELINKILLNINKLLDSQLENTDKNDTKSFATFSDQLSKLSKTIEYLDKKSNVIDDMGVFVNLIKFLQSESENDKSITVDFIKKVNKCQDKYITSKMSRK